jgi:phenylpyruvate tautomerase
MLKRPEKYVLVSYRYNEFLSFNGSFDPAFQLTVVRLGWCSKRRGISCSEQIALDNITPEITEAYSETLFEFMKNMLRVPGDRGYM